MGSGAIGWARDRASPGARCPTRRMVDWAVAFMLSAQPTVARDREWNEVQMAEGRPFGRVRRLPAALLAAVVGFAPGAPIVVMHVMRPRNDVGMPAGPLWVVALLYVMLVPVSVYLGSAVSRRWGVGASPGISLLPVLTLLLPRVLARGVGQALGVIALALFALWASIRYLDPVARQRGSVW